VCSSDLEYTAFFRSAREYFNRYASNAALVWSIDADSLHLMDRHYPGDDYVDWVGINIFVELCGRPYYNGID
jgi:beta-mannanase